MFPPWLPPPSWRGAPGPRALRLNPAELPGLALRVLEALTWEHRRPRPRPAGNLHDLLASISAVSAAGWLCVCARVRVCVRLCVRPAGQRAGPTQRFLQSPALHSAVARSCGRLTGGCVAPTLWSPRLRIRAPLTLRERQEPTPQAPAEQERELSWCALARSLRWGAARWC